MAWQGIIPPHKSLPVACATRPAGDKQRGVASEGRTDFAPILTPALGCLLLSQPRAGSFVWMHVARAAPVPSPLSYRGEGEVDPARSIVRSPAALSRAPLRGRQARPSRA